MMTNLLCALAAFVVASAFYGLLSLQGRRYRSRPTNVECHLHGRCEGLRDGLRISMEIEKDMQAKIASLGIPESASLVATRRIILSIENLLDDTERALARATAETPS